MIFSPHDDNWTPAERAAAEAYAHVCGLALSRQLDDVARSEIALTAEQRGVVEVTVLLELAAKITSGVLQATGDQFAVAAADVFELVNG